MNRSYYAPQALLLKNELPRSFKGFRLAVGSESHLATGRARFKGRAPLCSTTECGRLRREAPPIVVHLNPHGSGDMRQFFALPVDFRDNHVDRPGTGRGRTQGEG